ncbi:MAG: formate transporter [Thermoleophilaceae bacterium]|jgi:formate/nitrite transporter|nr:formate transporter [Thermoleophilaceae bacterium]
MAFKKPPEITQTGIETGVTKSKLSWDKALVASFLAGAYIAFGALLATTTTAGMDPKIWGTLPTFFAGAVFSVGLILVVIAGSELLTGNMALVPLAAFKGRVPITSLFRNFGLVTIGNLLGSLFVAYFLAVKSGVVTTDPLILERLGKIANAKGVKETEYQIFLRAVGCNWLVCLAVWMALAAQDVAGKVLAIFFPIMAFVAMGFDHVVANMFFLPAAIFAHVPGIGWDDALHNWAFAFLGNLVGAAIFVSGAYWYLYARDADEAEPSGGGVPSARGDGAEPAAERQPA